MAKTATTSEPAIYCGKCSYDLRGQVEHRCPECGRAYDLAHPRTFRRKPRGKASKWIKGIGAALIILLLMASAPYAWLYYDWRREQPAVTRMREQHAKIEYETIDPPMPARLLPHRFVWMLDRVCYIHTESPQFTDSDLILLARCRRLHQLYAPWSRVTDGGIEAISRVRELRYLWLSSRCRVTDASAAHLARCRQLSGLDLFGTSLSDVGLAQLCSLPNLSMLSIESSRLTNLGLPALARLPKLCELEILAPDVDDEGLAILSRLSRLQSLQVQADRLTPQGQDRLRLSLPRCSIRLFRYSASPASAPSTVPAN